MNNREVKKGATLSRSILKVLKFDLVDIHGCLLTTDLFI